MAFKSKQAASGRSRDVDRLTGVWSGGAFPGHEVAVTLTASGGGLLLFYWRMFMTAPVLDEFRWAPLADGQLRVDWRVCHEWVEEEQAVNVVKRDSEVCAYTVRAESGGRTLEIELGLNREFGARLVYIRSARAYDEEREALRRAVTGFDPARTWILEDDGNWRKGV
jgi:hypothetical protein